MCQISVYVAREGVEELLQEDVTNLVVGETGVKISSLFEGSQEVANTVVQSIDFMAGKVLLQQNS
ncbi:MAG: CooT family nickel-binding protein [Desulfobacterales bacterium]|nr:CooT family nickel-binding protein [Desulfobacterales bacterium]